MNVETVRALARAADLPLGHDHLAPIAELLSAWLPAASELSRSMSAPEHETVLPIAVFRHPADEGQEG